MGGTGRRRAVHPMESVAHMDMWDKRPDLPSWTAGYLTGAERQAEEDWDAYTRGRLDERRDESERWTRAAKVRPGLVEPEAGLIVDGQHVRRWTWRERAEQRRATIREAHAAGLHDAGARYCPDCPR